jgi:micrococcal nuclease
MIHAILITLALASPAAVETVPGQSIVIIDGDTIAVGRERIRIENIDTPETFHSRCEAELIAGLKAKERLATLLRSGSVVITRMGEDPYHRTLARLSAGGRDVGEVLVQEGFALPWKDGPAARATRLKIWCGE